MKYKNKLMERTVKTSPAIVVLIIAIALSFLLPKTKFEETSSQMGILGLMITRAISVSVGFVCAYLLKEWGFPTLSLTKSLEDKYAPAIIFLAMWYSIIIYCFSLGG